MNNIIKNTYTGGGIQGSGNDRNSSIELLRLLCLIGIVIMHMNGDNIRTCVGINMVWIQIENAIFQTGVSIFVLISGYYGIKTTFKRVAKLEITVVFYSVAASVLFYLIKGGTLFDIVKAVLPISTGKYWFISAYMLLMLISPYLNMTIENMNKKVYEKLLLLLIGIFYLVPSIIYFHILGDAGKGIGNFITLYYLGAYIKKYIDKLERKKGLLIALVISYTVNVLINTAISLVEGVGARSPFARDCSILILIEAVCIFILFLRHETHSRFINRISKGAVAIYLFEKTVRMLIAEYIIDVSVYMNMNFWFLINIALALITAIVCLLIEFLRSSIFNKLENAFIKLFENLYRCFLDIVKGKIKKWRIGKDGKDENKMA